MSKNSIRITGIILMMVSVFLLIGGLYLPQAAVSKIVTNICLIAGLVLLIVGIVFYKVLKSD
ncbi:MAG: hypothetical protein K6F84_09000 [Lachnospiraceae bacterium]|nr:hypothetical protein [Lachnospiraceae bacterium]